jgi:tRNA 2-thiouridine synthesizing protein C
MERNLMISVHRPPHGSIYVQEAIEVMFIFASYDINLSVVFMDDGVMALKSGQDGSEAGMKGFMASLGALVDFEVENVFVDEESLKERNISVDDLVSIGDDFDTDVPVYPKVVSSAEIREMMDKQQGILPF